MRGIRLFALLATILVIPSIADAQHRRRPDRRRGESVIVRVERWERQPQRQLALLVGVLNADLPGDDNFPMAALRADWRLARYLRSEVGVAYALGELTQGTGATATEVSSSLLTATIGLQAELPLPYIRPYVGAAAGLFGRRDEEGGERFIRPTHAFPAGVRIPLSNRLALRGEVRYRFDEQEGGPTLVNVEQVGGLSFTF